MHRFIALGIVAFLLAPCVAWSKEPSAIVPGSRIRITERAADEGGALSGTVVTAGADSVVMSLDKGAQRAPFALAGLSRVEVSRGEKGHTAAGIGLGFLAGAGIGALIGVKDTQGEDSLEVWMNVLAWSGIGAGVGMLVGGVIGAVYKTEKWEQVPVESIAMSAGTNRDGGVSLMLSMHF